MTYPDSLNKVLDCFEIPFVIINEKLEEKKSNLAWLDFCQIFILPPDFRQFLSLLDDGTKNNFLDFIDSFFKDQNNQNEYFFFSFNFKGTTKFFRIKASFLKSESKDKENLLFLLFHESISNLSSKIQSFKNSERLLRIILESAPTAVVILDDDEIVIYSNPAFINLRMSDALATGELVKIYEIYPNQAIRSACLACLTQGETIFLNEKVVDSFGKKRIQTFRIFPLRLHDKTIGVLAFIEDQTTSRTQETEFLNNYKLTLLGNLAGGIAHELNTPLGLTRLTAEVLINSFESGEAEKEEALKYLKQILKSVDKMAGIVKQVLRFSKGEELDTKTKFSLNHLIESSVMLYGKLFQTSDIFLEMNLEEGLPEMIGFSNQLQTVITDLINNSRDSLSRLKNCETKRTIVISTSYKEELDCIVLNVFDNGRILTTVEKEKLFDSFFDPNESHLEGKNSLGLGLSVSYGIIKRHGGVFTVESVENEGTRFTVLLPLADELKD